MQRPAAYIIPALLLLLVSCNGNEQPCRLTGEEHNFGSVGYFYNEDGQMKGFVNYSAGNYFYEQRIDRNEDGAVLQVVSNNSGAEFSIMRYLYAGGRLDKTVLLLDNDNGDEIDDTVLQVKFNYENDRVSRLDIYETMGFYDIRFEWTGGNISKIASTGEGATGYMLLTYDDKINPKKTDDYAFLKDAGTAFEVLSENNVIRVEYYTADDVLDGEETYTYTYSEEGLPLTRAIDGTLIAEYTYECN